MEIQEKVREAVLARVHSLGGDLVRIGEELQAMSKEPVLIGRAKPLAVLAGEKGADAVTPTDPGTVGDSVTETVRATVTVTATERVTATATETAPPTESVPDAAPVIRIPDEVQPHKPTSRKGKKSRRR